MKLIVSEDNGTEVLVITCLEEYNLSKPLAAADLINEIRVAVYQSQTLPVTTRPTDQPKTHSARLNESYGCQSEIDPHDGGPVYHAVASGAGIFCPALCGKKPGNLGSWVMSDRVVNCPGCRKRLGKEKR